MDDKIEVKIHVEDVNNLVANIGLEVYKKGRKGAVDYSWEYLKLFLNKCGIKAQIDHN